MVRLKLQGTILQHPLRLRSVVDILQFFVGPIVIRLVIDGVNRFKYEGMDVFYLIYVRERSLK